MKTDCSSLLFRERVLLIQCEKKQLLTLYEGVSRVKSRILRHGSNPYSILAI